MCARVRARHARTHTHVRARACTHARTQVHDEEVRHLTTRGRVGAGLFEHSRMFWNRPFFGNTCLVALPRSEAVLARASGQTYSNILECSATATPPHPPAAPGHMSGRMSGRISGHVYTLVCTHVSTHAYIHPHICLYTCLDTCLYTHQYKSTQLAKMRATHDMELERMTRVRPCVRPCMRPSVGASVRACVRACVRPWVRPSVRAWMEGIAWLCRQFRYFQ